TAHMGGLVAGFLAGVALLAGASAERQRVVRSIAIVVAGVAIALAAVQLIPSSPIDRIIQLNNQMFTQRQHLDQQLDAHEITPTQFADILDRDIIPAWHDAKVDLDDAKVGGDNTIYVEKLRTYVWLEEDELTTLSAMLRANKVDDPDTIQNFTEKQHAASAARRDLQDESQGVSPK
ncbi:MAG TPA: hypothetical protein VGO00_09340, partial [Kofleriaceae bacterium]|nr:hypothetical protein [Kofleriaceae bacterium]